MRISESSLYHPHTLQQRQGCLLKSNYTGVIARIDITLIYHIVCHMVVISTCNKDDIKCRKFIKIVIVSSLQILLIK